MNPNKNAKSIYRDEYSKLIELLKDNRKRKSLSQSELGKLLGQDQTFVSKYETGIRRLDILETLDICRVLEIDMLEIVREIKTKR